MTTVIPAISSSESPRAGKSKGGRKEIPAAQKRTKRIVLHVTEATYAELKEQSKASGRPLAVIVRGMTRPQRPGLTPEQFGLFRQLAGMATNLNQLAKLAHQVGFRIVGNQVQQAADLVTKLINQYIQTDSSDD